jgi:hypothetical protein
MSLEGAVYRITDAKTFFTPIVLGSGPPTTGYEPWPGVTVGASLWGKLLFFAVDYENLYTTTDRNGRFAIADPPANLVNLFGGYNEAFVSLLLSDDGRPVYRSGVFPLAEGDQRELNIYLFPDELAVSDGIGAGDVSGVLGSSGLPGNTQITASPSGLSFNGSEGQVSIQFGISLTPDTSNDLNAFIDLTLASWNINVDWPTSWFKSATDVLNDIRSGLAGAASSVNSAVLAKMETIIETEDGLPSSLAETFFNNDVSVTFMDVWYPTQYTWGIGDKDDSTVVVMADPCIGYPRNFSMDPIKHKLPWWWVRAGDPVLLAAAH